MAGSAHRPSLVVGFAAETEQLLEYAEGKRLTKQLDVVIANDVSQADIGFNSDINGVTWLDDTGTTSLPLTTKQNLAKLLIERCRQKLSQPEDQNKHISAPAEDNR